jgi:hypothetical protein
VIEKQQRRPPTGATNSTPRPGDFPLGSPASRAAARLLAQERRRPRTPPMEIIPVTNVDDWQMLSDICAKIGQISNASERQTCPSDYWVEFVWAGDENAAKSNPRGDAGQRAEQERQVLREE